MVRTRCRGNSSSDLYISRGYLALVLFLCILQPLLCAQEQAAVEIGSEEHHHLVFENEKVRVFSVTLGAHTEMPLTRHEHNFLVITLADSEIALWAEGRAGVITYRFNQNDIRFYYGGPARAMRNDTASEYHNLTIEFLNPKVTTFGYQADSGHWEYGSNTLPPPVDAKAGFSNVMPLEEAKVKDVQLLPDDVYAAPEKPVDELFIPLTEIELKTTDERIRKSENELFWVPAGRKKPFVNNAAAPARMVVIEFH